MRKSGQGKIWHSAEFGMALACLVGSCAPRPPANSPVKFEPDTSLMPTVQEPERDAIGMHWIMCLRQQANVLDDDRSDASTIGVAIDRACSEEKLAAKKASSGGLTRDQWAIFSQKFDPDDQQFATTIVLRERKLRSLHQRKG